MAQEKPTDKVPDVVVVRRDPREQIREVLDFYKFALRPDANFNGTVVFDVAKSDISPSFVVTIQVRDGVVDAWEGLPRDGKYRAYTEINRDDFFFVYSGKASVAAVGSMCLTGRIKVRWFRFHDLQQFAASFDYSTPTWITFYRNRGDHAAADDLVLQQWKLVDASGGNKVVDDATGALLDSHALREEDVSRLRTWRDRKEGRAADVGVGAAPSGNEIGEMPSQAAVSEPEQSPPGVPPVVEMSPPLPPPKGETPLPPTPDGAGNYPDADASPAPAPSSQSDPDAAPRARVLVSDVSLHGSPAADGSGLPGAAWSQSVAAAAPPTPIPEGLGESPAAGGGAAAAALSSTYPEPGPRGSSQLPLSREVTAAPSPGPSTPEWREVFASEEEADMMLLLPELLQKRAPPAAALRGLTTTGVHGAFDHAGQQNAAGPSGDGDSIPLLQALAARFCSLSDSFSEGGVVAARVEEAGDRVFSTAAASAVVRSALSPPSSSWSGALFDSVASALGFGDSGQGGGSAPIPNAVVSGAGGREGAAGVHRGGSAGDAAAQYPTLPGGGDFDSPLVPTPLLPMTRISRSRSNSHAAASEVDALGSLRAVGESHVCGLILAAVVHSQMRGAGAGGTSAWCGATARALLPLQAALYLDDDGRPASPEHQRQEQRTPAVLPSSPLLPLLRCSPLAARLLHSSYASLLPRLALERVAPLSDILRSPWAASLTQLVRATSVQLPCSIAHSVPHFSRDYRTVGRAPAVTAAADSILSPQAAWQAARQLSHTPLLDAPGGDGTPAPSRLLLLQLAQAAAAGTVEDASAAAPVMGRPVMDDPSDPEPQETHWWSAVTSMLQSSAARAEGFSDQGIGDAAVAPSPPLALRGDPSGMDRSSSGAAGLGADSILRSEGRGAAAAPYPLGPLGLTPEEQGADRRSSSSMSPTASEAAAAPPPSEVEAYGDEEEDRDHLAYLHSLRFRLRNESARFSVEEESRHAAFTAASPGSGGGGGRYLTWGPRHPLLAPPISVPLADALGDSRSGGREATSGSSGGGVGASGSDGPAFGVPLLREPLASLPAVLPTWMLEPPSPQQRGNHDGDPRTPPPLRRIPLSALAASVLHLWGAAPPHRGTSPSPAAAAIDPCVAETALWALGFPIRWPALRPRVGTVPPPALGTAGDGSGSGEVPDGAPAPGAPIGDDVPPLDAACELSRLLSPQAPLLPRPVRPPVTLGAVVLPASAAPAAAGGDSSKSAPAGSDLFLLPVWHLRRLLLPSTHTAPLPGAASGRGGVRPSDHNGPTGAAANAKALLRKVEDNKPLKGADEAARPTAPSSGAVSPWVLSSRGPVPPNVYNSYGSGQFQYTAEHRLRLQFEDAMTATGDASTEQLLHSQSHSPSPASLPSLPPMSLVAPGGNFGDDDQFTRSVDKLMRLTPMAVRSLTRRFREWRILKVYGGPAPPGVPGAPPQGQQGEGARGSGERGALARRAGGESDRARGAL